MFGLHHTFLVRSTHAHPYTNYAQWLNDPSALRLHVDVLEYIHDSLQWVPCFNPANHMIRHAGLNMYGPTIIQADGAVVLHTLCAVWAHLFGLGPPTLHLTGKYEWVEAAGARTGRYEPLSFDRDLLGLCYSTRNYLTSLDGRVIREKSVKNS